MTRPKYDPILVQKKLELSFESHFAGELAAMEFPFPPLPEHELRVADVAVVSREVLSASNTAAEIKRKERL